MNDEVRTEQASASLRLNGLTVEIGAGSSPTPGVHYTVDHRTDRNGVGCEDGKWATPDVCADMAALPFRDRAFDTLVAIHLLEHDPDTNAVLAEWSRVAAKLVIVCPDQEHFEGNTVGLDPTHRACFTPGQLGSLLSWMPGDWDVELGPAIPRWSFMAVAGRTSP
jgi:SAM-dependent methyltransferase